MILHSATQLCDRFYGTMAPVSILTTAKYTYSQRHPNRYAWFNGVDPKAMRKTDGTLEGAEQCVEVESYKGRPEWECE